MERFRCLVEMPINGLGSWCQHVVVLSDLQAATDAYRAAQQAVVDAEQALAARKAEVPLTRQRLAEAIAEAARNGVRQSVIVKITGYQRERIRTITRAAGIRPDGTEDEED
jgi:hypothetical protein